VKENSKYNPTCKFSHQRTYEYFLVQSTRPFHQSSPPVKSSDCNKNSS